MLQLGIVLYNIYIYIRVVVLDSPSGSPRERFYLSHVIVECRVIDHHPVEKQRTSQTSL